MMDEEYDVIDISGEEYAIVERFSIGQNTYALICRLLEDDALSEEASVVKIDEDSIWSIEDDEEKQLVKEYLDKKIQDLELAEEKEL